MTGHHLAAARRSIGLAGIVLAAAVNPGCETGEMVRWPADRAAGFAEVKPLLQEKCLPCHQGDFMGAAVPDFRTPTELFDPARRPRLVVPGDPERSRLLQVIYLVEATPGVMPPLGHGLTPEERNLVGEWIRQGATWPDGEVLQSAAVADRKKAW